MVVQEAMLLVFLLLGQQKISPLEKLQLLLAILQEQTQDAMIQLEEQNLYNLVQQWMESFKESS